MGKLLVTFYWSPLVWESKVPWNGSLPWENSHQMFVLERKKKLVIGQHQCLSEEISLPRTSSLCLLSGDLAKGWAVGKMIRNPSFSSQKHMDVSLYVFHQSLVTLVCCQAIPTSKTKKQGNVQNSHQQKRPLGDPKVSSSHSKNVGYKEKPSRNIKRK